MICEIKSFNSVNVPKWKSELTFACAVTRRIRYRSASCSAQHSWIDKEAEHHAVMWGDVGLTEMLWAYDGYVVWENQHSRRRVWRSKTSHTPVTEFTVDGWIETTNTLQHWLAWRETLRHPLVRSVLLQQHRASAGSLAVILQPAFVHFFGVLVITLLFVVRLMRRSVVRLVPVLLEKLPVDFGVDV